MSLPYWQNFNWLLAFEHHHYVRSTVSVVEECTSNFTKVGGFVYAFVCIREFSLMKAVGARLSGALMKSMCNERHGVLSMRTCLRSVAQLSSAGVWAKE